MCLLYRLARIYNSFSSIGHAVVLGGNRLSMKMSVGELFPSDQKLRLQVYLPSSGVRHTARAQSNQQLGFNLSTITPFI